jgi:hypothetical protein
VTPDEENDLMIRRRLLAGTTTIGLAVAGVAIASSSAASSQTANARPHLSECRILRIAETAAARTGDPLPSLIEHSEGTRYKVNLVASGDIVPGRQWSYLIAEQGHFVLKNASRPPGARAPRGSVLTLVVDASTAQTTDVGVSHRYPHLTTLGHVTEDAGWFAYPPQGGASGAPRSGCSISWPHQATSKHG